MPLSRFLLPNDPPPLSWVNETGEAPVLLLCDHASARIPTRLGDLGLSALDRARHIAWDIGAAAVTRHLAHRLGAPALLAGFSRLVIDLNRPPGEATSIPPVSDGSPIPGNQDLAAEEEVRRISALFEPYHSAAADKIAEQKRRGPPPAIIAIHSYTPVMAGVARPWHAGILWSRDPRLAVPLLGALRALPGLEIGDNQPYSGQELGYTIGRHADRQGLPHVSVEIRQDLVADEAGALRWADILAEALGPILAQPDLYRLGFA